MNGLPQARRIPSPPAGLAQPTARSTALSGPPVLLRPAGRRLLYAGLSLAMAATTVLAVPAGADAATSCSSLSTPVYYQVNPKSAASLLTTSSREASNAASTYGFTTSGGTLFRASARSGSGLAGVHRLFRRGDFYWTSDAGEISAAVKAGYADQGVNFYAATASGSGCSVKVQRWTKSGRHQVSVDSAGSSALTAAGWKTEGSTFYAAPGTSTTGGDYSTPPLTSTGASDSDGVFTIAVLPDTQQEVFGSDTRFADRNAWLVANRKRLDLRFETQVGDLVNWDTPTHDQYTHASNAMKVSEAAGLPWSPTIGNHDAAATCTGGGACPHTNVRLTVRDTRTFNTFFPPSRFRAMKGTFEKGKVDNSYSMFSAEGRSWMVMNLELWPRTSVLNWASSVIKANPSSNVIIVTHHYLDGNGSIGTHSDYGDNAPSAIWDKVVKPNGNVKLVLSGHVGQAASRVDARSKNPVVSYLQTFHDSHDNPTRLITINVKNGSVRGQVYYPHSNRYLASADKSYSGMVWVK